jgi:hypothetical protein
LRKTNHDTLSLQLTLPDKVAAEAGLDDRLVLAAHFYVPRTLVLTYGGTGNKNNDEHFRNP